VLLDFVLEINNTSFFTKILAYNEGE